MESRLFKALARACARVSRTTISARASLRVRVSRTIHVFQSPGRRDLALPPPARGEPGRLVSVGRGGARPRARGAEADPGLDRLRRLPLVPRDGARVVRG